MGYQAGPAELLNKKGLDKCKVLYLIPGLPL